MRSTHSLPLVLLLPLLLLVSLLGNGAAASPSPASPEKECLCKKGFGACQHWLGMPGGATVDPCYCDRCREVVEHEGKFAPDGMNPLCFGSGRMACYLKRHSAAWHLACSECARNTRCCPVGKSEFCPDCDTGRSNPLEFDDSNRPAKETVLQRLEAEESIADEEDFVLLYNRHFYIVTDLKSVKVKVRGGGFRMFNTHEYAHLMLERAEMARKEFVEHFGDLIKIKKPVAIFLPHSQSTAESLQGAYFGSRKTNLLYGGVDNETFIGGMAGSGFCASGQKYQPDDYLHFTMRHMIAHALISRWVVVDGHNRLLPRWVFEGVAHWLSRYQERFKDEATWCADEGEAISASGKGWERDCSIMAARPKLASIEELFAKTSMGQMTLEDQKRAWSIFDLCLAEWREPFVKMLADLRLGKEVRDSFMKHLLCTPEIFDERWKKRVTGRRRSMSPLAVEDELAENETPSSRERKALRNETDFSALAARIRGLGTVEDPPTVDVLLDLFAKNSELVRETAMVSLLKIKSSECLERIPAYGLGHPDGVVRAYAARACGRRGIKSAAPGLRTIVAEDRHWLARAEAAIACGLLKDFEAFATIRELVTSDPAEKTKLAAMDAFGLLGEDGASAVPVIAGHLDAPLWQLRVGACQALGAIGSMSAVEPLIARMKIESGHVREEIQDALKAICRSDPGPTSDDWQKWWNRRKESSPNALPERPKKLEVKVDTRYAQPAPTYYGIQIYSNKIGFVLDTSLSMDHSFEPDEKTAKALSRTYKGTTKLQICKEEIIQTLDALDSRAHFSIIVFNTKVDSYKNNPIPASSANVTAAQGWLKALPPAGETNYFGGLRAALGMDDSPELSQSFRDTPDTLTFLTDGTPTDGEITDADTLIEWYTSLNRYARIRTHVIAFGNKGVDLQALRRMAELNGGRFVHVDEKQ